MFRIKAVDWSTEKRERKEYLYYECDFEGNNFLGIPVNPVRDHILGKYQEPILVPRFDERTGEQIKYEHSGQVRYLLYSLRQKDG